MGMSGYRLVLASKLATIFNIGPITQLEINGFEKSSVGLLYRSMRVGDTQFLWSRHHRFLVIEMQFEITPLDCLQPVIDPDRKTFPAALGSSAGKERGHINAIDGAVIGYLGLCPGSDRRKEIYAMYYLIGDDACRDLTGPPDNKRYAYATFPGGEVLTAPGPGPAIPGFGVFGTVIAQEYNDGIVAYNTKGKNSVINCLLTNGIRRRVEVI